MTKINCLDVVYINPKECMKIDYPGHDELADGAEGCWILPLLVASIALLIYFVF